MLKKMTAIFVAFMIFCGECFAQSIVTKVETIDESVELSFPQQSYNIMEYGDVYFFTDIYFKGNTVRNYNIICYLDGVLCKTFQATVNPYTLISKKTALDNVAKGMHQIMVKATYDGENYVTVSQSFAVVKQYTDQPADEFSRIGLNTHIKTAEEIAVMARGGIKNMRQCMYWNEIEKQKNVYSFGSYKYIKDSFLKYGVNCDFEGAFGNITYTGETDSAANWQTPPLTMEQINAFAEYIVESLKNNPTIRYVEIWNEPNLVNRNASMDSIHYTQLVKATAKAIKQYNPNIWVMGGALASKGDVEFTEDMIKLGAASFIDAVSIHPYCYPNNPDKAFASKPEAVGVFEKINQLGGWLEVDATETGFPNHISSAGISEQLSAIYFPKMFILGDEIGYDSIYWHNGVNNGWDEYNREHNFGILRADFTPKPAYTSMSQLCIKLNNARYVGMFSPKDGINAYLYIKEGQPLAVMWSTDGEAKYSFAGGTSVEDINGNVISDIKNMTIGESPVYVENFPYSFLEEAVRTPVLDEFDKLEEEYSGKLNLSVIGSLKEFWKRSKIEKESSTFNAIKMQYDAMDKLIEENKSAAITDLSAVLYRLYEVGTKILNYYTVFDAPSADINSDNELYKVKNMLLSMKKGDDTADFRFADKMISYAMRFNSRAHEIEKIGDFQGKNAMVKADNLQADLLCTLAQNFSQIEDCNFYAGVFPYINPTNLSAYPGNSYNVSVTFDNGSKSDIDGEIIWKNPEGETLGIPQKINIKAGQSSEATLPLNISLGEPLGEFTYKAQLVSNGKTVAEQWLKVNVLDAVKTKLNPSEKVFSELGELTVDLTSNLDEQLGTEIEISAPEGWSFTNSVQTVTLQPFETRQLKFSVSSKRQTAFNEYVFTIRVRDSYGNILSEKKYALDFLTAVKASAECSIESFDGNIADWSNAYPIHLGTPENADDREAWQNSTIAARAYAKWDDNYYYQMVDVCDDYSSQYNSGYNMWQGDSLQLSFDPCDDGGQPYKADDYEYGFSFTGSGEEIYIFQASEENGGVGNCEASGKLRVIRDRDKHITRYLIKLPKSMINALQLCEGSTYGFNININDADAVTRESYIQFTTGTGNNKKPEDYCTFILKGNEMNGSTLNDSCVYIDINSDTFFDY